MKRIASRVGASVAALGIGFAFMMGTAGTASAAAAGFKICNYGSGYSVSAHFPDRGGFSTYAVRPGGACTETTVSTGERFYLTYTNGSHYRSTTLDRTFGSGRTLVQTWGDWSQTQYGKLPY